MAFESGVVTEGWTSAVIVPLYKGKGKRTECKNYRGISLLSVVLKRIREYQWTKSVVTEGLIDDERVFQIREGVCRSNLHD